jgi:hypothetical protein
LQTSDQKIITPADSVAQAVAQVRSVQVLADATVAITTDSTSISIGPAGEVAPGIMPAAGFNLGGAMPQAPRGGTMGMFCEALVSCGLGGFLLTIGILTMKNSPWGRTMHLIYAVLKILAAGAGAYATYVVWIALATSNDPSADTSGEVIWIIIIAAVGMLYPLALLVLMNVRGVREFYKTPVVGRIV